MKEEKHSEFTYKTCPYITEYMYKQQMIAHSMFPQRGQFIVYPIQKYVPVVSYGHGSNYSDFWHGDGPYPNYYAGAYPFPYANYPYQPLPPTYQNITKKL